MQQSLFNQHKIMQLSQILYNCLPQNLYNCLPQKLCNCLHQKLCNCLHHKLCNCLHHKLCNCLHQNLERNLQGVWGRATPTTLKTLPFRRAKMAVRCTLTGQSTGQRTIGELLLLKKPKKGYRQKVSQDNL